MERILYGMTSTLGFLFATFFIVLVVIILMPVWIKIYMYIRGSIQDAYSLAEEEYKKGKVE